MSRLSRFFRARVSRRPEHNPGTAAPAFVSRRIAAGDPDLLAVVTSLLTGEPDIPAPTGPRFALPDRGTAPPSVCPLRDPASVEAWDRYAHGCERTESVMWVCSGGDPAVIEALTAAVVRFQLRHTSLHETDPLPLPFGSLALQGAVAAHNAVFLAVERQRIARPVRPDPWATTRADLGRWVGSVRGRAIELPGDYVLLHTFGVGLRRLVTRWTNELDDFRRSHQPPVNPRSQADFRREVDYQETLQRRGEGLQEFQTFVAQWDGLTGLPRYPQTDPPVSAQPFLAAEARGLRTWLVRELVRGQKRYTNALRLPDAGIVALLGEFAPTDDCRDAQLVRAALLLRYFRLWLQTYPLPPAGTARLGDLLHKAREQAAPLLSLWAALTSFATSLGDAGTLRTENQREFKEAFDRFRAEPLPRPEEWSDTTGAFTTGPEKLEGWATRLATLKPTADVPPPVTETRVTQLSSDSSEESGSPSDDPQSY